MNAVGQVIQNIHAPTTIWDFIQWFIVAAVLGALVSMPFFWEYWKMGFHFIKSKLVVDVSKDPEWVSAAFDKLINEKKDTRSKCSARLRELDGKLRSSNQKLDDLAAKKDQYYRYAEQAQAESRTDDATEYVRDVVAQEELIKIEKEQNAVFFKSVSDLKEAMRQYDSEIREIERQREVTVSRLQAGLAVQSIYDQLDDMRKKSLADQLVDAAVKSAEDVISQAAASADAYADSAAGRQRSMQASVKSSREAEILRSLGSK